MVPDSRGINHNDNNSCLQHVSSIKAGIWSLLLTSCGIDSSQGHPCPTPLMAEASRVWLSTAPGCSKQQLCRYLLNKWIFWKIIGGTTVCTFNRWENEGPGFIDLPKYIHTASERESWTEACLTSRSMLFPQFHLVPGTIELVLSESQS